MTDGTSFWPSLLVALGLMFVLEGVLPFFSPKVWREAFRRATELTDGQIRFIGLGGLLAGAALLICCWT